ncbi:MAG: methyltransferase domain-containing protein [Pseudomonadota bacterium]
MTHPLVFDRALGRRRLARAAALEPADFLLERTAEDLAERVATVKRAFAQALDLGTATDAVARALCDPLLWPPGSEGGIGALYRAAPLARSRNDGASATPVPLVVADEEALPFADASLDLVVSALALQSVNDLPGAFAQIRRALRPDGLFLAAMIGGASLSELREAFAIAESEITGGISPRVAPFVDVRELGGLLQRAGFALPVTDVDRITVRYGTPFALFSDLRRMGASNTLVERRRVPLRRATLLRAAEIYAEQYSDPDGRVRATFEIVWLSGWAPHESQQKPLKPGSAKMRLADALGVREENGSEQP